MVDGKSGFLCKVGSASSLSEIMIKFLKESVEQRARMGQEGRWLMKEQFDKEKVVQMTYERVV